MICRTGKLALSVLSILCLLAAGGAPSPDAVTAHREPCADHNPLRNPYFGDLHAHTTLSLDASTQGTRNRPRDAYRFARGELLGIQPYDGEGNPLRSLQLARPLDFVAVTDHTEMLGEREICETPGLVGHDSWVCRLYRRWPRAAFFVMNHRASGTRDPSRFGFCGPDAVHCLTAARTPWREIQEAAEDAYDRTSACRFTTFVGYEWTGAPDSYNLHRNVIFRGRAVPDLPTSYVDAPRAELLWDRLRADCIDAGNGCDALTVPHNSNLSNGLIFQTLRADGSSMTLAQARVRARFEVLVEVMQHKGDSECMPGMGTEDELCAFEKLSKNTFKGRFISWMDEPAVPLNFTRNALKEGLAQEEKLGVNPFKFGLVGSTDTHLGSPGAVAEDETFLGHGGAGKPARDEIPKGLPDPIDYNPGGLAVLWSEENSRDSLFAAMRRREAYATSGPRLVVRFFGGWALAHDLCKKNAWVETAYASGVPMGGDLPPAPEGLATHGPSFIVSALRDPGTATRPGTPLQRIQIVKGWLQGAKTREHVYDVAGNPDNHAGVDLDTCTPFGVGFDSLCTVWTDPDFDPGQRAFYYARVVENPICRWSQRVCNTQGVDCQDPGTIGEGLEPCCDPSHRRTVQERAWSSPIWYGPQPAPTTGDP